MPEYKKLDDLQPPWPKLRRFMPLSKLPGKWFSIASLSLTVTAYVIAGIAGTLAAAGVCVLAILLGIRGIDTRGRGLAVFSLVLAGGCLFVYLIAVAFATAA